MYFRDAQGIIFVYDITDYSSYEGLKIWLKELKMHGPEQIYLYIAANKSDLKEHQTIDDAEIGAFAKRIGAKYVNTSCLTGDNINVRKKIF